jgi:hypothetical protein
MQQKKDSPRGGSSCQKAQELNPTAIAAREVGTLVKNSPTQNVAPRLPWGTSKKALRIIYYYQVKRRT